MYGLYIFFLAEAGLGLNSVTNSNFKDCISLPFMPEIITSLNIFFSCYYEV